jgi:hypothetical protein
MRDHGEQQLARPEHDRDTRREIDDEDRTRELGHARAWSLAGGEIQRDDDHRGIQRIDDSGQRHESDPPSILQHGKPTDGRPVQIGATRPA